MLIKIGNHECSAVWIGYFEPWNVKLEKRKKKNEHKITWAKKQLL